MVSVSKYRGTTRYRCRTFNVSDGMVRFQHYSRLQGLIHSLNFPYSDFNYILLNIISSFRLKLDVHSKYRVSSIEHDSDSVIIK